MRPPLVTDAQRGRADAQSQLGSYDQAQDTLDQLLAKQEDLNPTVAFWVPTLLIRSAHALRTGDQDTALTLSHRALETVQQEMPQNSWITVEARLERARVLAKIGDWENAHDLKNQAVSTLIAIFGTEHPLVLEATNTEH
ncbi:MAG: hypothetical protein AAF511_05850 [Pseudomonadota bacterium]